MVVYYVRLTEDQRRIYTLIWSFDCSSKGTWHLLWRNLWLFLLLLMYHLYFFTEYTESRFDLLVTSTETLVRNGTICDFLSKADVIQKQRRPEWPIETAVSVDANRGTTHPLIWAIILSSEGISSEVTWHMTFKYQLCQTGYNIRDCCHLVHNLICNIGIW